MVIPRELLAQLLPMLNHKLTVCCIEDEGEDRGLLEFVIGVGAYEESYHFRLRPSHTYGALLAELKHQLLSYNLRHSERPIREYLRGSTIPTEPNWTHGSVTTASSGTWANADDAVMARAIATSAIAA